MIQKAPPLVGRLVPFVAVAAANCINIPMMRQKELQSGIPVFDEDDNRIGESKVAAKSAILQVAVSRVIMAMPGMSKSQIKFNLFDLVLIMMKIAFVSAYIWQYNQGLVVAYPGTGSDAQTAVREWDIFSNSPFWLPSSSLKYPYNKGLLVISQPSGTTTW